MGKTKTYSLGPQCDEIGRWIGEDYCLLKGHANSVAPLTRGTWHIVSLGADLSLGLKK